MKYIALIIWLVTLPVCYVLAIVIQSTKELLSVVETHLQEATDEW